MLQKLRTMFWGRGNSRRDQDWPSIVMLLREPHIPTAEEAVAMASAAWGAVGPVHLIGTAGPHNFVIRIDPLTFALHAVAHRYVIGQSELSFAQKQPWEEHRAWFAVDLPGQSSSYLRETGKLGDAYQSLVYFVAKHWSPNCLAIYFPGERVTVPNHGDFIQSIRWARANGMNLDFLKKSKS